MEAKPCPMCGSTDLDLFDHGVACRKCGLWYGAGSCALARWRILRGDLMLAVEQGWIVESWNIRKKEESCTPVGNCHKCVYYARQDGTCRRHAPTYDPTDLHHPKWPNVYGEGGGKCCGDFVEKEL